MGLDVHEIAWYMAFLRARGFNAIRFLFNTQDVLENSPLDPPNTAKFGVDAPWEVLFDAPPRTRASSSSNLLPITLVLLHSVLTVLSQAPELEGYRYIEMFSKLATVAADYGDQPQSLSNLIPCDACIDRATDASAAAAPRRDTDNDDLPSYQARRLVGRLMDRLWL